jgi:hypothetical protein
MIFVYPSLISENVKDHIYPAIAKTLEQFYLLHILESFSSGNLRVKTVWDPRRRVYGALQLEHKKHEGVNIMLMECLGIVNDAETLFHGGSS